MAVPVVTPGRRRRAIPWGRVLGWAFLGLMMVLTVFPIYWVFRTAFTHPSQIYQHTTALWPPGFTWVNFARVLGLVDTKTALALGGSGQKMNFFLYLRNSVVYSALNVSGQVFFSAMAAYAFARLRFPGRDKIFFLFVTALMVPGVVTLIPNFVLIRSLGLLNTLPGMLAPTFFMTPFAVFFLRQFFLGLNREVEEAAQVDGAGPFTVFWRIALPMCSPALATLAILAFIDSWNNYLWPLLTGADEKVRVLMVGLAIFRQQTPQGAPDWTGLMAANALAMLPTFALFLLMGRKVIDSIRFSGFR